MPLAAPPCGPEDGRLREPLGAADWARRQLGVHLVMQIHDELLFEVPRAYVREAVVRVKRSVTTRVTPPVPNGAARPV